MSTPTAFEQEMLELINRARMNPLGESAAIMAANDPDVAVALRYFKVNMPLFQSQMAAFSAVAPLAWNAALGRAAEAHSALMIKHDVQSHRIAGELSLGERVTAAGYTGRMMTRENVFAYTESVQHGHAGFVVDWGFGTGGMQTPAGHRLNIMAQDVTEVGIGALADTSGATRVGPWVVTQDFANRAAYTAQLLGVAIRDGDGDRFYDAGEGMGAVTVTARGVSGSFTTTTWAAGGYQMALVPGAYAVTFSGGGLAGTIERSVTFGSANLKLDAVAGDARAAVAKAPITGTAGADALAGTPGDDLILGLAGNDRVAAGAGDDIVMGEGRAIAFDAAAATGYQIWRLLMDSAPDPQMVAGWASTMAAGQLTPEALANAIMARADYKAATAAVTTDAGFVTRIFTHAFDRTPDAATREAWTGLIDFGQSRAQIAAAMATGTHMADRFAAGALGMGQAAQAADWSDDVIRLYQATLDRLPDAGGFAAWTTVLASGRPFLDAITGFVNSREFQIRFGTTTDTQFVTLLYQNVLDRAPDAGGLKAWTDALGRGVTRAQVTEGFAQSREFRLAMEDDVLAYMRAAGGDVLDGDGGSNILAGGIGADTFVFDRADGGRHMVADLERWDMIDLNGFGYASAAQALARMTAQDGNTVFSDQGVQIVFADTAPAQILADMILV